MATDMPPETTLRPHHPRWDSLIYNQHRAQTELCCRKVKVGWCSASTDPQDYLKRCSVLYAFLLQNPPASPFHSCSGSKIAWSFLVHFCPVLCIFSRRSQFSTCFSWRPLAKYIFCQTISSSSNDCGSSLSSPISWRPFTSPLRPWNFFLLFLAPIYSSVGSCFL